MELRLPKFEETAEEATIAKWLKQPGDAVVAGEPVVEIETEKFAHAVEAPAAGVMREHCVAEGDEVEVGSLLAILDAA